MRHFRTITSSEMRGINRSAVLDLIRREGPTSRSALAVALNVSLPTIMRIVEDLAGEGLVAETGNKEWSGGRKRTLIEFSGSNQFMIGIDLGGTKMYGAVADLSGRIHHELTVQYHRTTGEESYQGLCEMISDLLGKARDAGQHVRGVGVGAPGIVSSQDGVVYTAPGLEWQGFPLKARLSEDFHLPVIVDNDVNLGALGELWFGPGLQNMSNLVVITIGTGIGAGIILNGSIYRGSHQAAGEIGYMVLDRAQLGQVYPGFGAFEQLASGSGIAERARKILADQGQKAAETISAEEVFDAAGRGEGWAQEVVNETVDYLAQAIAAISLCFDPDAIVLGGGVARSANILIPPILKRLEKVIPFTPHLVASSLGYQATVMGAVINLLYHTSDFYVVHKLS
jgi:glucokinase